MASPCEQRIENDDSRVSMNNDLDDKKEKDELMDTTAADDKAGEVKEQSSDSLQLTEGHAVPIESSTEQQTDEGEHTDIVEKVCNAKIANQEENEKTDVNEDKSMDTEAGQAVEEGEKFELKSKNNDDSKSFMSMIKESEGNNDKDSEKDEAEILGLNETNKHALENLDEESEKALLAGGDEDDADGDNKVSDVEEENMDTSEKLQQPKHFGMPMADKEPSDTNSRNDADTEVEMEMRKQNTMHLPETVYDIDEETRMGLDQTPVVSMMNSTMSTPLPPKKLFNLDDTKDSADSETKLSVNTDTEDIRLRNTISVDQENTKDSVASDSVTEGPTPSKRMKGYREGLGDVLGESKYIFTAENLFEYQWPQDGGEWHLLQEHVSEYLKVKSFKRKYPDLYRRVCDKEEKDFLREKGVVSETQSDLGLTALRSEEVYDLMMKDYNDKYQEYISVLQEKQKRVMREKHKEYGVAKLDKSKMDAYSKKAARCAAEFNASLMREKKEERQAYFDLQTYTIHYTKNRFRTLPPEMTKVGSYPVALISGQYQDKFRRYTPDDLCNFPLKTALTDPPHRVKYLLRPPASLMKPVVTIPSGAPGSDGESESNSNEEEIQEEEKDKENVINNKAEEEAEISSLVVETDQADSPFKYDKKLKVASVKKLAKVNSKSSSSPDRGRKPGVKRKEETNEEETVVDAEKGAKQIHGLEKCRICKQRSSKEDRKKDRLIRCAQCNKIGHMSCLDLTEDLVAVIKTYPWQCMECKTCVQCMDPYDEDKMMFCDRCDRGYHTFCIGLNALPTGHWECRSCVDRPDKSENVSQDDSKKEINSHNVIKDETQDSQDGITKEVKESKGTIEIIDTRPLQESDLTTEYLMKLAGRNTNWRKDTTLTPSPTTPPTRPAPTSTPTPIKKEKDKPLKRKRIETNLNPTRSRPDRIQGARQSKRIKAREEDEDEKKIDDDKKKDEDDKKKKKKKKNLEGVESKDVDSNVKAEKENGSVDKVSDDIREEVVEGVDDSEMVMFERNEDEEEKMEIVNKKEEKSEEEAEEKEEYEKEDEKKKDEEKREDKEEDEEKKEDKERHEKKEEEKNEKEEMEEEQVLVEKEDNKELEMKEGQSAPEEIEPSENPDSSSAPMEEQEMKQEKEDNDIAQHVDDAVQRSGDDVHPEIEESESDKVDENVLQDEDSLDDNVKDAPYETAMEQDVPTDTALEKESHTEIALEKDIPTETALETDVPTEIAVEKDVPSETALETDVPTEIAVEKDVPSETVLEKDVPINIASEKDIPTEIAVEKDVPSETVLEKDVPVNIASEKDVPIEFASEKDVSNETLNINNSSLTPSDIVESHDQITPELLTSTTALRSTTEFTDPEKGLSIKPPSPSLSSSSAPSSSSSSSSSNSPPETAEPKTDNTENPSSLPLPPITETETSSSSSSSPSSFPPLPIPISLIPLPPPTSTITSISDIPLPPYPPPLPSASSAIIPPPTSSSSSVPENSIQDVLNPDLSTIPLPMEVD